MAWFRMLRSLRTYLIVGLLITVAILTFSTSKMIRVDASDSKSSFPFLTLGNNQDNHKQISGLTASALGDLSGVESSNFDAGHLAGLSSTTVDRSRESAIENSSKSDIHTTSAGLTGSEHNSHDISSSSSSTAGANLHSKSKQPGTFSDTIVVSPFLGATASQKDTESAPPSLNINLSTRPPSSTSGLSKNGQTTLSRQDRQPSQERQNSSLLGNDFSSQARSMRNFTTHQMDPHAEYRRGFIRDMMRHAWSGYANYAWGYNELRPISRSPHTESIFGSEKLGASIVDGLDTLYLMGLHQEYSAARDWIEKELDVNKFDADLSVFETNIRYVGGLLSAYALTKDRLFLNKAVMIADKLLPAFDTPSGIPQSNVNLRTGYSRNHDWAYGSAILSEFGSMHLEFIYLSHATGDPKYREKVMKIRDTVRRAVPRSDGLYNNYMNTDTGQWLTRPTHISMGALGDSFYEYLIKAYIQMDHHDREAYQMYMEAIQALENKLMFTSTRSRLVYFAELKDTSINHKMDALACFSGGMLALGAENSDDSNIRERHMTLASGIANTCHEACVRTKSHLAPETFVFSNQADAIAYGPSEKYYILRPEIVETYFYMWRHTHDPKYRSWAWDFAEALERYCKVEAGYSGLRNVYQPVIKDDVQQSFLLAETLKYLYLIFSDDNLVSLDEWVFNTEAHPLPILKHNVSLNKFPQ